MKIVNIVKKHKVKSVLIVFMMLFILQFLYTYNRPKDLIEKIYEKIHITRLYQTPFRTLERNIPKWTSKEYGSILKYQRYEYTKNGAAIRLLLNPGSGKIYEVTYENYDNASLLDLGKLYEEIDLYGNNLKNIKKKLGEPISRTKGQDWFGQESNVEQINWAAIDGERLTIFFKYGYPVGKKYEFGDKIKKRGYVYESQN